MGINRADDLGDIQNDRAVLLLALPQPLLRALAFRDVFHDSVVVQLLSGICPNNASAFPHEDHRSIPPCPRRFQTSDFTVSLHAFAKHPPRVARLEPLLLELAGDTPLPG